VGLTETSVALAGCVLVLVLAIILDRRSYRPGKLNYIPLMIIALAAILVLGRHLLALLLWQRWRQSSSPACEPPSAAYS
jgi:flagellar biosynthesis protein FliQ